MWCPRLRSIRVELSAPRAPVSVSSRRSDHALVVRTRLWRGELEGLRDCGRGRSLCRGVRPRGPLRARTARAATRHVPAPHVVEPAQAAPVEGGRLRAAKRSRMTTETRTWPLLNERAPFATATHERRGRR